jgi:D-glutamate cyclase
MGKARVYYVFREANIRGIPTIGVGDGGNEIGMGLISDAVRLHANHGEKCQCGCGSGVGAVTPTGVLMTATVSDWGCYAIVACLSVLLSNPDLLHTSEMEAFLQRRGVELGLINSPAGRVDPNVNNLPLATHQAVAPG